MLLLLSAHSNKIKECLAQNRDNVSEERHVYHLLLFQSASIIKIQLSLFFYYKADNIIILIKCSLFLLWDHWKMDLLALNDNNLLINYKWLVIGRWFSLCTLVSSTNTADYNNMTEILLEVVLTNITLTLHEHIEIFYCYLI